MSQYFIDKLVYNNDTLDIHDTEAREMINTNTTNIQAVSARVTKNANDIDALENTTNVIREDLDNVEDRVSVTEAEIDGLKTRTTSLEGKMVTVENRLDGHDTKISDLEDRMDVAENNITALDGRMTTAERDIDALDGRLDLVEAKNDEQDIAIDDLETNVSKNTADIVDIKDDLTGIHTDINDLDDRITASTYEAGIGIYFGQGVEHTNINVEDEILNQINQNTIDIQNLKTRVTNVENRLTVVEGDITDIKAEIVNIKADITALTVRVTALEAKILPAGGVKGQILKKASNTDYDVEWGDIETPIYDYTEGDTFVEPIGVNCHMRFHHITASNAFWDTINLDRYIPVDVAKAVGIVTGSYIDVEQKLFFDDADNKAYYYYTCKFVYSLSDRPDCVLVFTGSRTATSSINWVLESSTGLDIGRLSLINATPNFYAENNWYPLLNVLIHNYNLRNVAVRVNNFHTPSGTIAKLTSYDVPIRIYMDGSFGEGCGFTTIFTNMDTSTLYSVNFEYDYTTSTWTPTYKKVSLT